MYALGPFSRKRSNLSFFYMQEMSSVWAIFHCFTNMYLLLAKQNGVVDTHSLDRPRDQHKEGATREFQGTKRGCVCVCVHVYLCNHG